MERLAPLVGRSTGWLSASFRRHQLPARAPSIRTRFEVRHRRAYELRHEDAFDLPFTPTSAYWVGVLWADGHFGRGGRLRLVLRAEDYETVKSFKAFLGSTAPVETFVCTVNGKQYWQVRLVVWSTRLCRRLETLGLVSHRSERGLRPAQFPADLQRHLLVAARNRGYLPRSVGVVPGG